jgi:hypothetical protein
MSFDATDLEFARREHLAEMGESSPSEASWLKWCDDVERLLGRDLDGDQATDGYSLDFGYEAFCKGTTAAQYVAQVLA